MVDELRTSIERKIAAISNNLCLKPVKSGFSLWTFASVPVVAIKKKLSFIHNGIECTCTEIKNFMNIPFTFYLKKKLL